MKFLWPVRTNCTPVATYTGVIFRLYSFHLCFLLSFSSFHMYTYCLSYSSWGKVSQSNLELNCMTALLWWFLSLPCEAAVTGKLPWAPSIYVGVCGSELRSSGLLGKGFNHWAISWALICGSLPFISDALQVPVTVYEVLNNLSCSVCPVGFYGMWLACFWKIVLNHTARIETHT